jgi:hypothetical protein
MAYARINDFLVRLRSEAQIQQAMKPVTTAAGLAAVAEAAGFELSPASLVKDFAQRLLDADDDQTVRLFDNCGWDHGEIAWVLKSGDTPEGDVVGGTMKSVVKNMAELPDADRNAIAAYIKALPGRASPPKPARMSASVSRIPSAAALACASE